MLKRIIAFNICIAVSFFSFPSSLLAKAITETLVLKEQKVNITGKEAIGLSINGSFPGPIIRATVGDTLRITVKNHLNKETSIHWHGVLLPNNMDGVPYINTPPIKSGETFVYEFPVKHSGTYWYHSHSGLQEQQGIYGAIIFYPKNEVKNYDEEHVVVLSDWTNENPEQVLANIKKEPDYYALKKDSVQSWFKVLSNGLKAVKLRIESALNRMSPMDLSDVGYDAYLINGRKHFNLSKARPGTRIRLRIINAATSSYFKLEYSGGPMEVIEADGVKVDPFTATRIRIAMAETYDVIVTVPESKTYELRASAEDGTGFTTASIGSGKLVPAPTIPKPNLVLMEYEGHGAMAGMHDMGQMDNEPKSTTTHTKQAHSASHKIDQTIERSKQSKHSNMDMMSMPDMDHSAMGHVSMDHMQMNMNNKSASLPHMEYLDNYRQLKSPITTTLPSNRPSRVITLNLTGSMERYVWTINNKPMYAADKIHIKKGENVTFVLVNQTMMHHPIHLHGHFFRVLNGQGDHSPLKHTVNVAPFETVTIEFEANEEKDWIFHCHNLYHMKLGMGGIISYEGNKSNTGVNSHGGDHSVDHGNKWFNATKIEGFSNLANATTKFMRNDDNLILDARHNYKADHEVEAIYQKYISQFLGFYAGVDSKREKKKASKTAIIGAEYTLPFFIKANLRVNSKGKLRFGIGNEHQLTDRMAFDWKWNTNKEYTLALSYSITKQFYVTGNYDSRECLGIGLTIKL